MKSILEANWMLFDLLNEMHILEVGVDKTFENNWLYTCNYPISLNDFEFTTSGIFHVQVFRWNDNLESLKLISMQFLLNSDSIIEYTNNPSLSAEINQLGEMIEVSEFFKTDIKQLLIEGLRNFKIHYLLS